MALYQYCILLFLSYYYCQVYQGVMWCLPPNPLGPASLRRTSNRSRRCFQTPTQTWWDHSLRQTWATRTWQSTTYSPCRHDHKSCGCQPWHAVGTGFSRVMEIQENHGMSTPVSRNGKSGILLKVLEFENGVLFRWMGIQQVHIRYHNYIKFCNHASTW